MAKLIEDPQTKARRNSWGAWALLLALLLASAVLVYSARHWSAPERAKRLANPVPATPAAIAAGREIYQAHCQRCHGASGDGKGQRASELAVAPSDFTNAQEMSEKTDGELFWKITKGRLPMPAFESKLTDQERWEAVDYIRTFAKNPASAPAP